VLLFAGLTLSVGGSLYLVRGREPAIAESVVSSTVPMGSRHD
jgi:hypothetical protein